MFCDNAYMKVWKIIEKDGRKKLQVSSSKKNPNTNQYETDFMGLVEIVGKAKDVPVKIGDRICLTKTGVTVKSYKNSNGEYTNFTTFLVFGFMAADGNTTDNTPPQLKEDPITQAGLPF